MSNVVIKAENVSKFYRLGVIGHGTLARDLQSWWARFRGKEDPNLKIDINAQFGDGAANQEFWALRDIFFDINQGDIVGIIGRNGAGKSTLLKILSRVTAPTGGLIKVRGRVASLLEVGTGFHPELTGRENVYLNGTILGMTRKEIDKKFDEIIAFSEVEKFIDTPVKRYSSGMYVRLAFAVAAHLEPEILIVDEVLAVGDALFQKKCLGKMQEVGKEGRTVLFVSHNIGVIRSLCQKGILLDQGRMAYSGPVSDVIDRYIQSFTNNQQISCMKEFDIDDNLPAQLLKVGLSNGDGQSCQTFDVFDEINLEIEYVIRRPIEGLATMLAVERNTETLFVSFDTDRKPEWLGVREPGLYKSRLKLPNPLKAGRYLMHLSLSKPSGNSIDPRKDALAFDVEERSFDASMCSYSSSRSGVMAANLDWETEFVNTLEESKIREVI